MFVREVGRGPVVVVLHGTLSPASESFPLVDALAPRYRVLTPDLPGYGRSPAPPDARVDVVGDQLAAMLAAHDATRVQAIVGYSTGAYRALDLVLRAAIEADVIIAIAGMAAFDEDERAARRELARRLDVDPDYLGSLAAEGLTTPAAVAAELYALAASRDLRPELARLRARLYARVGTLDRGCAPRLSEEMTALAPRATLELVIGRGHALMIEDGPATVAAIVREIDEGRGVR